MTTFKTSKASAAHSAAWIETGVVANVNVKNLTIDWVSQYTSKSIQDLQIMKPYFHFNNGEGFTCIPEVGAICAVCWPSDDDPPFVIGFLGAPELEGADIPKIEDFVGSGGVETSEGAPTAVSTSSTGSTDNSQNPTNASYRGGLPILNPGDMIWKGRDDNFVILRRGGVLQVGSTDICQRIYLPVLNFIRDISENWELNTAAGRLSWTVEREEDTTDGKIPTNFTLVAREYPNDKKASVKVFVGSSEKVDKVSDKTFIEVAIAPQNVNPDDGKLETTPVFVLRVDKTGNTYTMQAETRTEEIKGDHKMTISGDQDVTVEGDRKLTVSGSDTTNITGAHTITGDSTSDETWTGMKTITAQVVKIGDTSASEPAVLGLRLAAWLASHIHPPFLPPVTAATVSTLLSSKVFVAK